MSGAPPDPAEDLLTEAEISALLLACSHRSTTGVRNRALIALLYCSGLRIKEALDIQERDVDVARRKLRVPWEVQRHGREVDFMEPAAPYLEAWLALRRERGYASDGPLFCTVEGAPLKDAYTRAMFARTARKAGISKRVHAVGLRRAFASRLHEEGASIETIRRQLGHADRKTTLACLAEADSAPSPLTDVRWSLAPEPGAIRVEIIERRPSLSRGPGPPDEDGAADVDDEGTTHVRRIELPELG